VNASRNISKYKYEYYQLYSNPGGEKKNGQGGRGGRKRTIRAPRSQTFASMLKIDFNLNNNNKSPIFQASRTSSHQSTYEFQFSKRKKKKWQINFIKTK
jgi:hypothetical protein